MKSVIEHYANNTGNFLEVVKPGAFLDPDMIIVGDFGLSYDQQKMQLGMWAIFAAPLYMSNDLRHIDPASVKLLQNKLFISINQDPMGKAGRLAFKDGDNVRIWVRYLSNGNFALAATYYGVQGTPIRLSKSMKDLSLSVPTSTAFRAVEVFDNIAIGTFKYTDQIPFYVNPTGINFFYFTSM